MVPNKINNKRYITDILENENKNEIIDENNLYFRKFKGTLRNSYNSTKNKFLSRSLGFNNNSKEEKNNLFNLNDKCSKTVLEDKKQSLYKLSSLNGFRPLSITQKPFRLKINISQNDFMNEGKAKSERKELNNFDENKDLKILIGKKSDQFDFEEFINIFSNKKSDKYKTFEEIYNISIEKYDSIIEKIKSLSKEIINYYIFFIKYSLTHMKDLVDIFGKLRIFYNIIDINDNNKNEYKINNQRNSEIMRYKKNIQQILSCDSIHIYIYDAKTDSLILKGESEEIQFPKDKDLIGKCFISGTPINYKVDENLTLNSTSLKYRQLDKNDKIFIYPIKDIDNNILGVFEVIYKNFNISDSDVKCSFDKKDEIIMSFISKAIGLFYICF